MKQWIRNLPAIDSLETALGKIEAVAFDFDGVFTDNRVYVLQNGEEAVVCDRSDGMGISMLRDQHIPMVIISTENNPVVSARAAKLQIEVHQGIDRKISVFENWVSVQAVSMDRVAFIGNDINDIECLLAAGLGIVVADAHPKASKAADMKLTRAGGRGAIREFVDLLLAERRGG